MEAIQASINGWMDKQIYTYNGISLSLKKEENSDTCWNMNEFWRNNAKWNNPATKGQVMYESIYMRYLK